MVKFIHRFYLSFTIADAIYVCLERQDRPKEGKSVKVPRVRFVKNIMCRGKWGIMVDDDIEKNVPLPGQP